MDELETVRVIAELYAGRFGFRAPLVKGGSGFLHVVFGELALVGHIGRENVRRAQRLGVPYDAFHVLREPVVAGD